MWSFMCVSRPSFFSLENYSALQMKWEGWSGIAPWGFLCHGRDISTSPPVCIGNSRCASHTCLISHNPVGGVEVDVENAVQSSGIRRPGSCRLKKSIPGESCHQTPGLGQFKMCGWGAIDARRRGKLLRHQAVFFFHQPSEILRKWRITYPSSTTLKVQARLCDILPIDPSKLVICVVSHPSWV